MDIGNDHGYSACSTKSFSACSGCNRCSNTNPSAWIPFWSGLYYAINVTSSLALVEYQPTHPIAQAIVMLNVIAGYLFLGIGIGIVGQFVKNR